jgi:hypothetical protein
VNRLDTDDFGEIEEEADNERDDGESITSALEVFMKP